MKKFKIGYFGDGEWAHKACKMLLSDHTISIEFICTRFESKDLTLKTYANNYSIPYFQHKNINSSEFINEILPFNCDIFVSMSFNQIFKNAIINLPRLNIINCHAGKLPFYRGRNVLNWALINDEKEFGITVHFIDEGIDTGDIILQNNYPITDDDNYGTLLQIAYTECAKNLYNAVKLVQVGKHKVTKQESIHPTGFYCSIRKNGDEVIDWNQNSRRIFNFIRALSIPGPLAQSKINGKVVKINKSSIIPNAPSYIDKPGSVIGILDNGKLIVKTKDSSILIDEYFFDDSIKIGDRLVPF